MLLKFGIGIPLPVPPETTPLDVVRAKISSVSMEHFSLANSLVRSGIKDPAMIFCSAGMLSMRAIMRRSVPFTALGPRS